MSAESVVDAPEGLRVIVVNPVCAIGEINRCIVTVWADQPTSEIFIVRNNALLELVKRHRGNAALIEVVEATSRPPSDPSRKVAMEVFRELGNDLCAIGFVMEGSSWRISMARAVIQSMAFIVPKIQPTKVFKQPAPMLEWVAQRLQNMPVPEFTNSTIEALEYLRKRTHAERSTVAR